MCGGTNRRTCSHTPGNGPQLAAAPHPRGQGTHTAARQCAGSAVRSKWEVRHTDCKPRCLCHKCSKLPLPYKSSSKCDQASMKLHLWTWKPEFQLILYAMKYCFDFFTKNLKTKLIINFQVIQKLAGAKCSLQAAVCCL